MPGDHVGRPLSRGCGRCRYCAAGGNLCQLGAFLQRGPQLDGTYRMHLDDLDISQFLLISSFSPWSVLPAASLVKVPNDVPLDVVCLLGCGVGTGFGSAVNAAGVRPGAQRDRDGGRGSRINAVQGASAVQVPRPSSPSIQCRSSARWPKSWALRTRSRISLRRANTSGPSPTGRVRTRRS